MDDEIIKLQEIVAHQGSDIEKISKELYLQQKEVYKLQEKVRKLEDKIKNINNDSGIRELEDETPPPHY